MSEDEQELLWCPGCKTDKASTEFHKCRTSRTGYASACRKCRKGRNAISRAFNEPRGFYRRKYGISVSHYYDLLAVQEGKCAICGTMTPSSHREDIIHFCVDHDHATGKARGLLCVECNVGLGGFKDNHESLARAIEYLSFHRRSGS